jgi:2-oxoisovalerate dehydrogenase E2 component (dihydrolipoyl transacylase)
MPDFLLPDLGEGLTEAEIVTWHVAVGDRVQVDQTVVDVETAKATVEVPVPFAGTVSAVHGAPGDAVQVGAPLVSVTVEHFAEPGVETPDGQGHGSGNVLIGYGTGAQRPARRRRPHRSRRAAAPLVTAAATPSRTVAVASPLVRRMARQAGLDLTEIVGSGPDGLVLRRDVEAAVRPVDDGVTRIRLQGTRKAVADKLSRSRREIPEATVWVDVDATPLLDARAAMNAPMPTAATVPVSILALVSAFAIAGLVRYPQLNARVDGDEIVLSRSVGLGFAAQTDRGLVVPVIPDAQTMSIRRLSAELAAATQRVRGGGATPAQLRGGTFTLNNYGVFGVDGSAAIINHPEVAILGLGRIIDRPWVVDGELSVRKVAQLTLAFDHRVCDGATAGGFLRYVANCMEAPVSAFADLRPGQ